MKLQRLEFDGLTHYDTPQTIDLRELPPGLVAFVGRTGSGKTTALEVAPVSLFKRFPTRPGSIYDWCNGKGYASSHWLDDDGRAIEVRLTFDAERRKASGHVFIDGEPYSDGGARSFDDQVESLFGSSALFLAGVFAAQDKRGSFLKMQRGDRKALFAELLLLGHYETLAQSAGNRHGDLLVEIAAARKVISEADQLQADIDRLDEQRERERIVESGLREKRDQLQQDENDAARAYTAAESFAQQAQAARAALDAAESADAIASKALQDAEAKPQKIDSDAKRLIAALRERDFDQEKKALERRHLETTERLQEQRAALGAEIQAAADPEELQAKHESITKEIRGLDREAEAFNERRVAKATAAARVETLSKSAELIERVPCDRDLGATCPLLDSARTDESELVDAMEVHRVAAQEMAECRPLEARTAERANLTDELADVSLELRGAYETRARRGELDRIDQQVVDAGRRLRDDLARLTRESDAAAAQIEQIAARLPEELQRAQAELAEARQVASAARTRMLDATEAVVEMEDAPDLTSLRVARNQATRRLQECDTGLTESVRTLGQLSARIDDKRERLETIAKQREEHDRLSAEAADWSLLAEALGKQGVQALEIDAAGPEVASLANELLSEFEESRFTLRFDTLRAKKSDDGFSEVFDVTVYDGAHPRTFEGLSGGQQAIVAEALSMAIAIYNARKNRIRYRTLWRDETAGALDGETAAAYVLMLRRAMALGDFEHVLFVAHSPDVYEAADVQFIVEDRNILSVGESAARAS